MYANGKSRKAVSLGVTTAMAAVLLSACASNPAPNTSMASAAHAQAQQQNSKAIAAAEAGVQAHLTDAEQRMALGDAYLDAGRFASAETAFRDSMTLGNQSARAALSLALAQIAQAKYPQAAALLNDWDGEIAKADLGLALSLAGQPERGIHIMSNAIRAGENTMKMRQNLAYAFAMAGRWREARLMAQQDLPSGEVNSRLEEWAALSSAGAYQHRIANLLRVPVGVADAGLPTHLALSNAAPRDYLAAADETPASAVETELAALAQPAPAAPVAVVATPVPAREMELAPLPAAQAPMTEAEVEVALQTEFDAPAATPLQPMTESEFVAAFNAPTAVDSAKAAAAPQAIQYISNPVVQSVSSAAPSLRTASITRPTPVAAAPQQQVGMADGTHLIQLGSFSSEAGAKRAWDIYIARFPELAAHERVITQAIVRGKRYWRVSAGGFNNAESRSMCGRVNSSSSDGCIAWASSAPLPGSVNEDVMLARR